MITNQIKRVLFHYGFNLNRVVDTSQVKKLISQLAPMDTKTPLVRIGDTGDGGYLVPDDLDGIECCFSPGVYEVATFEKELMRRRIPCFLADNSVEKPPVTNELLHFEKKHIGVVNNENFMTLASWISRHAPTETGDLMLQMDIERAEYAALLSIPTELLSRFRIIVIEFHDIDKLFDRSAFRFYEAVFEKLCSLFNVVHIHPNNWSQPVVRENVELPPLMEFTFYRKDRSDTCGFAKQFPHPLDSPNVADRPNVNLPKCWLGKS